MTTTGILDIVTDWARENICSKILLKAPPDDDADPTGAGYDYKRVNPGAFAMYLPSREKVEPGAAPPIPSICVQCTEGEDNLSTYRGIMRLQLSFCTWSPGTYGGDMVEPNPEDYLRPKKWPEDKAKAYFVRTGDGWRDAWNMVDITLREIESVTNIGGLVIDRGTPIKYGPFTEQKQTIDFYPFWYAWVGFTLQYPIQRNIRGVESLL